MDKRVFHEIPGNSGYGLAIATGPGFMVFGIRHRDGHGEGVTVLDRADLASLVDALLAQGGEAWPLPQDDRSPGSSLTGPGGGTFEEFFRGMPEVGGAPAGARLAGDPPSMPPRRPLRVGYRQTLSEVLSALGWRHERPGPEHPPAATTGRRALYRQDGTFAGLFEVQEAWAMLHRCGYIAPAADGTP